MKLKFKKYISTFLFLQILIEINCNVESDRLKRQIPVENATEFVNSNFWIKSEEQRQCILNNCDDSLYGIGESKGLGGRRRLNIALLMPEAKENDVSLNAVRPVVDLAVKKVERDILPNFKIKTHPRNTQCSSTFGPLAAVELWTRKEVDVFLGPVCGYVLAPVARYCSVWNMSIITTGGMPAAFQWKATQFPTLTRIMGSYNQLGLVVKNILNNFNWTLTAYLYHNFAKHKEVGNSDCQMTLAAIYLIVGDNRTTIHKSFDEADTSYEKIKEYMKEFKLKTRIIIMCANPNTIRNIMLAAEELKMIESGEYVFFNIDIFGGMTNKIRPWYNETDTDERNNRAREAYEAMLTVTVRQPTDEQYMKFSDQVKSLAKSKYNYTFEEKGQVSTFVTAFYDAVLLYAYALNATIAERGENVLMEPLNSTKLATKMWGRSFQGITGNVTIDADGDRKSDYTILDMNPETGDFEIVANYLHSSVLQFLDGKKIHWPGGRDTPTDSPKCGFDNSLCPNDTSTIHQILIAVLFITVVIMIVVISWGYRHYKKEAEKSLWNWKINPNDIIYSKSNEENINKFNSRTGSVTSIISDDLASLAGETQMFIPVGFFKGNRVAIKKVDATGINLNRALLQELKNMKNLSHDHLVKFYGAAIEDPDLNCILTEYCPKGSLEDILGNEGIKLDWMFKLSLMHDIVKGMHYLHNSDIHSHGSLKSSNCVVDSRFVLKITDFGLYQLRRNSTENFDSYAYWKRFLWTAPELLRGNCVAPEGTQKGDVYSFSIIVHEIITRCGVFYLGDDIDKEPKEIVQLVGQEVKYPNPPFRPKVDEAEFADINNLMVKCWAEDPNERPDFATLKQNIRKINKENETGNILDNLLHRMEQYANNLEQLVELRTNDYKEEKKKCEELLYQLLPRSVAAQLIQGREVKAEMYDQVTIYFSDIVGFTAISAESTPIEVVKLLNDLYTCFDTIVGNFDVYKVETIGDAYMVVSGLPQRNGNLHAREIARMSLALLNAVKSFTISHRPGEQLKLRIGLHSGPCCAGVVGLKMPRYCLFGDTVNTASRMESNGEALKIHTSQSTKEILDTFGNFQIEERGLVPMKGKGELLTYWLNGENTDGLEVKPIRNDSEVNIVNNTKNNNINLMWNPNNIRKNSSKKMMKHTNSLGQMNSGLKGSLINNDLINNNSNTKDIKNNQKNSSKKQLSFGKKVALSNEPFNQPLINKMK